MLPIAACTNVAWAPQTGFTGAKQIGALQPTWKLEVLLPIGMRDILIIVELKCFSSLPREVQL